MFAWRSLILISGCIFWGSPAVSQAQMLAPWERPPQHLAQAKDGHAPSEWLDELNLSPAQVRKLQTIQRQYRPQIQQRLQTLRQLRLELRSLMGQDASEAQVRNKYQQVEAARQEVRRLHFDSILAVREVLTPEQRRQVEAHMRNRYQDRRSRSSQHRPFGN